MSSTLKQSTRGKNKVALEWKKWSVALGIFIIGYIIHMWTADLSGFTYQLINDIGIFLSAAVAINFIYDVLIRTEERELREEEMKRSMDITLNAFMPSFGKWGFQGFTESMDYGELFNELTEQDELLWLDTYSPSRAILFQLARTALNRGAKIKMLTLHPDSSVVQMRSKEIIHSGFNTETFHFDLKSYVASFSKMKLKIINPKNFEFKLYNDLPCVPMYIVKRNGIPIRGYTSYFLSNASDNFAHIKWTYAEKGMLYYFTEYFEQKWKKTTPPYHMHEIKHREMEVIKSRSNEPISNQMNRVII